MYRPQYLAGPRHRSHPCGAHRPGADGVIGESPSVAEDRGGRRVHLAAQRGTDSYRRCRPRRSAAVRRSAPQPVRRREAQPSASSTTQMMKPGNGSSPTASKGEPGQLARPPISTRRSSKRLGQSSKNAGRCYRLPTRTTRCSNGSRTWVRDSPNVSNVKTRSGI